MKGIISSVHKGTAFETRALRTLRTMSMELKRSGGKSDGGVDLQGWWWLPDPSSPSLSSAGHISSPGASGISDTNVLRVRVLAQCKAESKKIGPNYIREMEGVMSRYMSISSESNGKIDVAALLVSQSAFTSSTLIRAVSSPIPFMLIHLPPVSDEASGYVENSADLAVGSAVWNPALSGSHGLLRGAFQLRWERTGEPGSGRPGLWMGRYRVKDLIPNVPLCEEESEQKF